ncbi:MAG: PIN domain-containing protein [Chloroflexi bacterium]|nr:PIN domain-containing protein [Chloroflexota bacterium]
MARPDVPDTSALLDALRRPDRWPALDRSLRSGHVWLSSVVVAELYAGTRSPADALLLDRIVAALERVQRVLTPTAADWARAGRLMARRIRLQGDLRPRDHLADVLILVSAARLHGVVVTANLRHFEAWARLAVASGLDVAVRPLAEAEQRGY